MEHEAKIRLGAFFGVLAVMALWEVLAPRRALTASKASRWTANFGVLIVDNLIVRMLFGALAVTAADYTQALGWGLFSIVALPGWVVFAVSILLLDFVVYLQHVMFHAIPLLWRFHMMHHADPDLDVSSGGRFHPVEIVISMVIKVIAIALIGPPVAAVVVFEVVLNATAMFNHSNVRMPRGLDAVLRWIVVTPDMHRVHHSVDYEESNSNFG
ncbi:MAG: sterol desaturase family protein, partial [bacterium]|nr:sterol desaturase family protein [bacterium]